MNQSLAPAFWCAITAAAFLAIAKHLANTSFWHTLLVGLVVVLLTFALAWGILALLDRLNSPIYALGDVLEKLMYPEIRLAEKYSRLDPFQLETLLIETGQLLYFIDEAGKPDWAIESMGRKLHSHWVSQFLYRANQTFPDLPAVRRNSDGSVVNMDERAMIAFLRALKIVRPRSGQTDIWAEGENPDNFRAAYFL